MTRRAPIIALAAAALLVSGCSGGGQAVTVGDAPKPTQSAAPVELGAKGELTQEQAEAALPTVEQVGEEWAAGVMPGEQQEEETGKTTFTPEQCSFDTDGTSSAVQLVDADLEPVAEAQADFHIPTEEEFSLELRGAVVSIKSYADPIDTSSIDDIAGFLEDCAEFHSTSADGVTAKFEVFPLSLPNYGDETLAFRVQGSISLFVIIADTVQVVSGHNLISVAQFGLNKIDTEFAGEVAAAVMENLDTVTTTT